MADFRELKPLTRLQTLEIMIVETKNELTKNQILGSLSTREQLRGNSVGKNKEAEMMITTKCRMLERSIKDLEDMYKEEKEKETSTAVPTTPPSGPATGGIIKT